MAVHDSLPLLEGSAGEYLALLELLQELVVKVLWRVDFHVLLAWLGLRDVDSDGLHDPTVEIGHVTAGVQVLVSTEADHRVLLLVLDLEV